MLDLGVGMSCCTHRDGGRTREILESGIVDAGSALSLVAHVLVNIQGSRTDFRLTSLNTDSAAFTWSGRRRFGGRIEDTAPPSGKTVYTYNCWRTTLGSDFDLVRAMLEVVARVYPELCSDEVRAALGLTEPSPTPR